MEVLPTIKCEPELNINQEHEQDVSITDEECSSPTTNRFVSNGNNPSSNAGANFPMDDEDDMNDNWQHPIDEEYEDSEEFISIDDDKAKSFLFNKMKSRSEVSTDDGDDDESGMFLEPEIVLESNDNEEIQFPGKSLQSVSSLDGDDEDVIVIDDDDDEDENMYEDPEDIDENEDGVELNWMDLERNHDEQFEFANQNSQKSSKDSSKDPNGTEFECNLCNKKVASSYNLRRHMMIHTGELGFFRR